MRAMTAHGRLQLVLRDEPLEAAGQRGDAFGERGVGDVDHDDLESGDGRDLRDAVAHRSRADDADGLNAHAVFLHSLKINERDLPF